MILEKYLDRVKALEPVKYMGRITAVKGVLLESNGPQAVVGELCHILCDRTENIMAEVVALKGETGQLMVFGEMEGIEIGDAVRATGEILDVKVGFELLGRVLDGLGHPIDGKGVIPVVERAPLMNKPPDPLTRTPIHEPLYTGIRSIDGLIPIGKGQRLGIFAGSGVGKSTLLGMIARNTSADVNVIALIGERGREVREFIENDLGPEGLKRSVIVVSTSDSPALARVRGAYTATAIAEYFRDQGKDVMLLFDSVTRFAMSQREIGLAIGEPPAARSYTPSVFTQLPKLLERSGVSEKGTITGIYSILVEGDDMDEPISDAVRGILDGHVVLARKLADRFHFPAVDVLRSISRLAPKISGPKIQRNIAYIRRLLAVYRDKEDLISIGAYAKGSQPDVDEAIEKMPKINAFLQQGIEESSNIKEILTTLGTICGNPFSEEELNHESLSVLA
ncbi:MAG: FliI/YscN family ATPase [Spirochaetaceae bacterium]|jgi:flagellum-specific ATP synthase|nr:FliI/YscN family ATPase [Spirochaetaceae bacterium]